MGTDEKSFFASLSPIVIIGGVLAKRSPIHKSPFIFWILIMIGILGTIVSESNSQILMAAALVAAILVANQLCLTLVKAIALRAISWYTLGLLVGGLVGIIYAYFVKQPLLELKVGYRTSYLYLTTFSLYGADSFPRPSGVFDEPGALAMFAAMVTMFNDIMRQNRLLNLAIITLLISTGSLAALLIVLLYFLASDYTRAFRKSSFAFIAVLVSGYLVMTYTFPANPLNEAIDKLYVERLQVEDGKFVGDNRSNQVVEFFELVDEEILFRGQKASAKADYSEDQSSNPFSIIFGYGLIISLPYYALLAWLAVTAFRNQFRNSYTSLGLLVLLLQRPYVYHMSWSILIASTVLLLYQSSRSVTNLSASHERPTWNAR